MNVAVVGLGSAGARHARHLLALGHQVVGFDPATVATPPGVLRAGTLDEAIEAAAAVVVAGPSSLHADHAVTALAAGRHVLVEKPLATTVPDAERALAAAERSNAVCAVAMNLRFHPGLVELRRLVGENVLGAVHFVRASFGYDLRLWRPGGDYRLGRTSAAASCSTRSTSSTTCCGSSAR